LAQGVVIVAQGALTPAVLSNGPKTLGNRLAVTCDCLD